MALSTQIGWVAMRLLLITLLTIFTSALWAIDPFSAEELHDYQMINMNELTALQSLQHTMYQISINSNNFNESLTAIEQRKISEAAQAVVYFHLQKSLFLGTMNKRGFQKIESAEISLTQNTIELGRSIINLHSMLTGHNYLVSFIKPMWEKLKTRLLLSEIPPIKTVSINVNGKKVTKVLKKPLAIKDVLYEVTSYEYVSSLKRNLEKYTVVSQSFAGEVFEDSLYDAIRATLQIDRVLVDYDELKSHAENPNPYQIMGGVDPLINQAINLSNVASKIFGNAVGAIRMREGHLYKNNRAINEVKSTLKPFDIVFEKTPFALTDKFIPGNFGHAALYIGTEEQLRDLGLWDLLGAHQADIRQGKTILEAVRPGVRLTSVEEFMNIDEIAIIRASEIDITQMLKLKLDHMLLMALSHIGKTYDFTFNVELGDTIVCSELIYRVFETVRWPTIRTAGRNNITPDNLAEIIYYQGTPFSLVKYLKAENSKRYHNEDHHDLAPKIGFVFDGEDEASEIFISTDPSKIGQRKFSTTLY